jgi:two-component system cell cycle sensor histidine kinase/response regulator CckA
VALTALHAGWEAHCARRELRSGLLWGLASVLFLAAAFLAPADLRLLFAAGSVACVLFAVLNWAIGRLHRGRKRVLTDALGAMVALGPHQQFLSDDKGRILAANRAGATSANGAQTLLGFLDREVADAEGLVARLLARAARDGVAQEVIPRRDGRLDLHVIRLTTGYFQWQVAREISLAERETAGVPRLPMLTVSAKGAILFMNAAARDVVGGRRTALRDVFGDEGPRPGEVNTVVTERGGQQCLVAEFAIGAGRRELYLLPTEAPNPMSGEAQFENLPVALLKVAVDGRVRSANRAARDLVRIPAGPNPDISTLMEGLGRSIQDWLAEAAAGHGKHHSEFLRLTRKDREVFVQVSLSRAVEEGEIVLIAVLSDATELKSLEAQFVQSQKMQAIGQLAGGVAHDFNNLLTAISGHCDLLLLRHDQGDPDYGDLMQINQNTNRAAALVGQLLAFSRKQNLRPEVLDLRDTLADLTHLLNRLVGEKVRLSLVHDPELEAVRADKRQLEQVLMNLVVNARDAMPEGGEVVIETERLHLRDPLERDRATVPPGDYVCVRVKDEGTGIPPDKLQKVFEPFFTTKRTGEGTGLGLSTAYGIVKQTGGYIFVDSTEGEGTCFTLIFPKHDLYESPQPASPQDSAARISAPKGGVVLLVEDEAPVRSFASRALRLRGLTVLEAGSGEEALEVLDDPDLAIDLFVTDVVMPGMDGPSWVARARQDRPDVKVVFMSGYAEESFTDKQARIAQSVFLPKPFSLTDLTRLVLDQLPDRAATDAPLATPRAPAPQAQEILS